MKNQLQKLNIFSLKGVQMRTFHITWLMFFVCFFGWFGLAPLMPTIRAELHLTKAQVGNTIIASVTATIIARLLIGKLCDNWGPRKTAIRLLLIGSIPVFLVGLAHDYTSFILFRLAIGVIGASFVITQFHTSMMFAPNIKGTANAVTGGWGNLGGGVTNMVMPLIFAAIVGFGYTKAEAWRYAMIVPGVMMLVIAFLYFKYTKDTPEGNYDEIGYTKANATKTDWSILADWRIWALTMAYAMCFGMELTFDNVASLHFVDNFHLSQSQAGFWAGIFGFMNLFARALGGIASDKVGKKFGMRGKGLLLAGVLLLEGCGLILFAQAGSLMMAIVCMLTFALFLKMSNGATYGIVPFVNAKNVGLVSGIVGAGGNLGGMLFGFLFKSSTITYVQAFTYIGYTVIIVSIIVFITRFQKQSVADEAMDRKLAGVV
ncbi:NarK family nitrate/nitrite MFS transporter [Mucilaginibacter sp. dw_454]|uniref:NarK family nitrate/nitrite MFS transporter n=1 Tax=Mucilaginibacter sp. dw_454 TaxID=2720079 RepID=UPI001BD36847|nr:NarK family nitrate/nitrite MFS transporter [Mucilaginibacter sp. dw_454]